MKGEKEINHIDIFKDRMAEVNKRYLPLNGNEFCTVNVGSFFDTNNDFELHINYGTDLIRVGRFNPRSKYGLIMMYERALPQLNAYVSFLEKEKEEGAKRLKDSYPNLSVSPDNVMLRMPVPLMPVIPNARAIYVKNPLYTPVVKVICCGNGWAVVEKVEGPEVSLRNFSECFTQDFLKKNENPAAVPISKLWASVPKQVTDKELAALHG